MIPPDAPLIRRTDPLPVSLPFWDYQDFLLFIAAAFPALLIAAFFVRVVSATAALGKPFQGLVAQLIWYALSFGALYLILRTRYGRPFWSSLGWKFPFRAMTRILFGGPLLAIAIGYLGYVLRTPDIQMPFRQMLANQPTLILFAIFVVILGPLCEELAFRGFLMPLLMRSFGPTVGIVVTGALFGCLHAPEYAWSWRHVLLITLAGSAFGWVRYRTGSTAASIFMHAAYNLTQLAAFLAQSGTNG
ncbi:MAG TPA: type II CAAX endopeptidase family protein [Bryobacteraceae bacterium]|nr:type II CAAX endopeptidase family protein [Bryobacteraceae bacterium]